ncbi:glycosyl transferase [Candidatus Woesebacteria bacterium]|nr:glycosyl transferase [Candidatus Woesebacteria bacterium]
MRVLILSWRDIKHPYGGGAELLSHEMAKRWVAKGNEVVHFSSSFPGAKSSEEIDGVRYLREGNWYNVHILGAINAMLGKFKGFDVVVDEVHGIPFFTKFYIHRPIVCLACEVARDIWDQMYPFPLSRIGRFLEKLYFHTYKNIPFLTISPSAKEELVQSGIPSRSITVLPMGFSYTLPRGTPPKEKIPTVIFLGRLVKTKGIEDAIRAFAQIKGELPKAKMWIVGKGEGGYTNKLKDMVKSLKLENNVEFKGFVSETEKFRLLARAHIILVPSAHEGWGLIVPEANIVGTPAIVYNVHGLRDVTKDGVNGIVVKKNNADSLAKESIKMLRDRKRYEQIVLSAKKYASAMNWDNTATVGMKVLKKAVGKK